MAAIPNSKNWEELCTVSLMHNHQNFTMRNSYIKQKIFCEAEDILKEASKSNSLLSDVLVSFVNKRAKQDGIKMPRD